MAARTAVGTGNWSNPATWDGGVSLPGAGDTADSNGFTVTIDQDITVDALINTNAGAGGFSCVTTRTITANITATVRDVLACSAASPVVVTVVGNPTGGSASNVDAIVKTGTGTLNVTGNPTGGSAAGAMGVLVAGTGLVNITGTLTGGVVTSAAGVSVSVAATVAITGSVVGATGSGISTGAASTVTISGNATGGTGSTSAYGASNTGAGTLTVQGAAIGNNYGPGGGSNWAPGINGGNNASGSTRVYAIQYGAFGAAPTSGAVVLIKDAANTAQFLCSDATTRTLVVGGGTAAAGVFKGAFG